MNLSRIWTNQFAKVLGVSMRVQVRGSLVNAANYVTMSLPFRYICIYNSFLMVIDDNVYKLQGFLP